MKHPVAETGGRVHPAIYRLMIFAAALYALAALIGFDRGGDSVIPTVVVGLFFAGVVILVLAARRQWRTHPKSERPRVDTLSHWLDSGLGTFTGTVAGREAATEMMLPLAAVSVGLVAIAVIAAFVG